LADRFADFEYQEKQARYPVYSKGFHNTIPEKQSAGRINPHLPHSIFVFMGYALLNPVGRFQQTGL